MSVYFPLVVLIRFLLPTGSILSVLLSGPPPPTDVTAVQDGPTSITVIWTPPSPLGDTTGYRISFTGGSDVDIDGGSTNSHTLTGLTNGQTYTISIVATSEHLFSDATTFEITLRKRERVLQFI